jgi:anthranilate phosphoribosyltransferase
VFVRDVLHALDIQASDHAPALRDGQVAFVPTEVLSPGLKRLLDARRLIGLRNSAHSLVKLMNPVDGPAVIVSSCTHPEYAVSMGAVFEMIGATALLLRGTEGEVVADARRTPQMEAFMDGKRTLLQAFQPGTLASVPDLPTAIDSDSTAAYIRAVMSGSVAVPASITRQVEHILQLTSQL